MSVPPQLESRIATMEASGYRIVDQNPTQVTLQNREGVILILSLESDGKIRTRAGGKGPPIEPSPSVTSRQTPDATNAMTFGELTGPLVSGNRYRVTTYVVEVQSPNGAVLAQIDMNDINAVTRNGRAVQVHERSGTSTELTTMSIDDAGRIEGLIRSALVSRGTPSPHLVTSQPTSGSGKGRMLLITAGILLLGCIVVAALGSMADTDDASPRRSSSGNSSSGNSSSSSSRSVVYTVTDTGREGVSLTYENSGGNTEQESGAKTPWTKRMTKDRGEFLYVSAQRGSGGGTVKCTITVNGEVVEEASSSGAFVIATCSGSAP